MTFTAKLVKNGKQAGLNLAGSNRRFSVLLRMNPGFVERMTGPDTTVCIEGFPRSANTFAWEAFRRTNPGERMAHHLHVPSQVLAAVARGIPCAVLVRRPIDALASMLVVDTNLSPTVAIRSYLSFYRRSWRVRDRVVACLFEEVTEDPGIVAERLNQHFGTSFVRHPPLTPETRQELLRSIESSHTHRDLGEWLVPVPTEEKERLKRDVRERLQRHPLLPDADAIFERWSGWRPATSRA